jgi:Transcription factor WhiB
MVQGDTCVSTVHYGRSGDSPGDPLSGTGGRDWRDRAVCRGVDPELFFPVGDDGPALAQIAAAKAVCARCPVVAPCLSFALVALPDGVAGGLTAAERSKRRRVSRSLEAGAGGLDRSRLPGGVDALVVGSLMAGHRVVGASLAEVAQAAVGLAAAGRGCRWIGTWLGVGERQVSRWLERHRAGKPLIPPGGRRVGKPLVEADGRQFLPANTAGTGARAGGTASRGHGGIR